MVELDAGRASSLVQRIGASAVGPAGEELTKPAEEWTEPGGRVTKPGGGTTKAGEPVRSTAPSPPLLYSPRAPSAVWPAALSGKRQHLPSRIPAFTQPPFVFPLPPQGYSMGGVARRLLRGDLDGAGAEVVGLGISQLYRNLDSMGFRSGGEFVAAIEE
eukprot:scaffold27466_cov101-Isochrysis_galbana.AAC.3